MKLVHYSNKIITSVFDGAQIKYDNKPNGFWVSDDDCEDNWRAWCESEEFYLNKLKYVHQIKLSESANILHIENVHMLDEFSKQYGLNRRIGIIDLIETIDWSLLAEKYDGIIITPYFWERRIDAITHWYYTWDCASGCIWHSNAIEKITVKY